MSPRRTWGPFQSKRSDAEYWVTLEEDGKIVCTCQGWKTRRAEKPRICTHIKDHVAKEQMFRLEGRGEFTYVVGIVSDDGAASDPILLSAPSKVQKSKSNDLADAEARGYVSPMLALPMPEDRTFEDYHDWVMELKYDGERTVLAVTEGGEYIAWSRPGKDKKVGLEKRLKAHIERDVAQLPVGVYDCELVRKELTGKSYNVRDGKYANDLMLVIFDIMRLGADDVTGHPYTGRRMLLERIANKLNSKNIILAETMIADFKTVKVLWGKGLEGVILKRPESLYRKGRRTPDWVKIKKAEAAICQITGFLEGENGPYSRVSLLHPSGIQTRAKTKNGAWLREFKKNPDKWIGKWLVIAHYGRTDTKFRGPIIWDHMAEEHEIPVATSS